LVSDLPYDELKRRLLPILAGAAVGDFDADVPVGRGHDQESGQILAGVQALLEVIRRQQQQINDLEAKLHEVQDQTTEILARVLDRQPTQSAHDRSSR
jgi:hypothetical protein